MVFRGRCCNWGWLNAIRDAEKGLIVRSMPDLLKYLTNVGVLGDFELEMRRSDRILDLEAR